jgi:TDG/mug DNA glycosylase family protein
VEDTPTLPDYLEKDLDIVFVGLNPSLYSAQAGHYFANPRNRFWAALNRSGLIGQDLSPEQDALVLQFHIGFTDVAKRPTPQASGLKTADFRYWSPVLKNKLLEYQPRIACFHGLTGYKAYLKYTEGVEERLQLGLQERNIGSSRVFVVPNPSPANAQYSLDDLVSWYQQLGRLRKELVP